MDPRLDFARELERRDEAVAERLDALARLGAEIDRIRARATAIGEFFARLPAERDQAARAREDAESALHAARRAEYEAAAQVESARGDDERARAEGALAAARADVRAAEERRQRALDRGASLEQEADQLEAEARDVERAAAEAAAALADAPRVSATAPPAEGLDEVLAWGARAHAAVLVARGGLEGERERIVREANELASSVLGEPLYASNVASVRKRLEERLP